MSDKNKPSYYAIIPADVRYSDIPPNAKLLYGEITALCDKTGYCWSTNKYFADLYKKSESTISVWISHLVNEGFIKSEIEDNFKRKIFLGGIRKTSEGVLEKSKGGIRKTGRGVLEKSKYSNTVSNTISNTIKRESARKKITTEDIEDFEQLENLEPLPAAEESSKKIAAKKVSFENQEDPNWMEVALAAIEYVTKDEKGKAQWKFMCKGNDVAPDDIMTTYFGKQADSPYILRNWKKEIPKMGNWIKNELKAIQKNGKQTGPKKHLVTPDQLDQIYRELLAEGYE